MKDVDPGYYPSTAAAAVAQREDAVAHAVRCEDVSPDSLMCDLHRKLGSSMAFSEELLTRVVRLHSLITGCKNTDTAREDLLHEGDVEDDSAPHRVIAIAKLKVDIGISSMALIDGLISDIEDSFNKMF